MFDTAGDHQAAVGIDGHAIHQPRTLQGVQNTIPVHPNVEIDCVGGCAPAVDEFAQKGPFPIAHAQAFPHAITQHEADVIDRNGCFGFEFQLSVDVNQNRVVAGVFFYLMCSLMVDHDACLSVCALLGIS